MLSDYTRAVCLTTDPEIFYPRYEAPAHYAEARAVCDACPVREACLADAMANEGGLEGPSRYGMRGGLTPRERARLSRKMREAS